jgi:hypothetical protein
MSKRSLTPIDPEVFTAADGRAIARWTITRTHASGEPYYEQEAAMRHSPSYPFAEIRNYMGARTSKRAYGELPSGESITLTWDNDVVECEGVTFARSNQPFDPATVERMAASWRTEYFCKLPNKEYLLVHRDANHHDTYRALIGDGNMMREVEVFDFARYRGSSPTVVTTAEGTLVAPLRRVGPPQPGDRVPTWEGTAVQYLATEDYVISETDDSVTISSPKKERVIKETGNPHIVSSPKEPAREMTVTQRPSLLARLLGRR